MKDLRSRHEITMAKVSVRNALPSLFWLSKLRCLFYDDSLVKMDGYFSAHAGKNGLAAGGIQSDQHRDALPDFGEVATAGVLVGQE